MSSSDNILGIEGYPPWNFTWVISGELAAMAWPQTTENLQYLVNVGIRHLITLSPEKRPSDIYKFPELQWSEIPIQEFEAPTIKQIKKFIDLCQRSKIKNEAIGIHCRQGRGRTGVMAACYLVYFQEVSPERAIINIRVKRPGSIETSEQERVVLEFRDSLRMIKM